MVGPTPKQRVLAIYPRAVCVRKLSRLERWRWYVYPSRADALSIPLAAGDSPIQAWREAARGLTVGQWAEAWERRHGG